jgi:glucan 1,3-beta-glucosidase
MSAFTRAGPVWPVGTDPGHRTLHQDSFVNAANSYGGVVQTQMPNFQPVPVPPAPFVSNPPLQFESTALAWAS